MRPSPRTRRGQRGAGLKKGLEGVSGSASIPTCEAPQDPTREVGGSGCKSGVSELWEQKRFSGGQWRWERPAEEEEPAWKRASEMVGWGVLGQRAGSGSLQPHPPHSPCSSEGCTKSTKVTTSFWARNLPWASLIPREKSELLACDSGPPHWPTHLPNVPSSRPSALTSLPLPRAASSARARPAPARPAALSLGRSQPAWVSQRSCPQSEDAAVCCAALSWGPGCFLECSPSPLLPAEDVSGDHVWDTLYSKSG